MLPADFARKIFNWSLLTSQGVFPLQLKQGLISEADRVTPETRPTEKLLLHF